MQKSWKDFYHSVFFPKNRKHASPRGNTESRGVLPPPACRVARMSPKAFSNKNVFLAHNMSNIRWLQIYLLFVIFTLGLRETEQLLFKASLLLLAEEKGIWWIKC